MAPPSASTPRNSSPRSRRCTASVAENPHGEFHFEMGRAMAERLGYAPADLDRIPPRRSSRSPASATISTLPISRKAKPSSILAAAPAWTPSSRRSRWAREGQVIGIDMTDEQRAKAERLRDRDGFTNVTYLKGYIENVPASAGVAPTS